MGYRIIYGDCPKFGERKEIRWGRVIVLSLVCFIGLAAICSIFWQEGYQELEHWIYPGDVQVTKKALKTLARYLHCGEPLTDAVTAFCREIIHDRPISG